MASCVRLGVAVFLFVLMADAVPREKFKTCEQSSFCRRCRKQEPGVTPYELLPNTLISNDSSLNIELLNGKTGIYYTFDLSSIKDGIFRFQIREKNPLHARFEIQNVLLNQPQLAQLKIESQTETEIVVVNGNSKAVLHIKPFKLDLYNGNQLVVSANARGLMRYEHLRNKPESKNEELNPEGEEHRDPSHMEDPEKSDNVDQVESAVLELSGDNADKDPGAWEENFQSHMDSKPLGPEAVALDFSFPGSEYAYGIPEHADSLALKSTKQTDPYRLYNLDVFEYEVNEKMSLYGAVPLLYAHGKEATSGIFWLNAAETWVDILSSSDNNVVESIVNFVSGSTKKPQVDAHFMSESGIIDAFFLPGPKPVDAFKQYTSLTGTANLPPSFSLGYHQCRWNYVDEEDVLTVANNFDKYDLPLDVMWLDIEYTDGKKYFTWDKNNFPHPLDMIQNLTSIGRKLVVIIDPHIKRDSNYFVHNEATSLGLYVKNKDGSDFDGHCWPGSSSYLDFFSPKAREYYSGLYDLSKFEGTTNDVHIWNDMNEPSVFSGPEVTMPKDLLHHGGWEHRDVHNIYGFMHTLSTYEGLIKRSGGTLRPFILTRAFFAGSQRYAAVWTGDNAAEWEHLRISYPMCLSLAISGISFCGADVGGFFKHPSSELFVRWYQAAAWLPFFRQHAHNLSKRREPWTFDDEVMNVVRETLRLRYSYLPLWYTLFREHEINGTPVIMPLWAQYPTESECFTIDDQLLVGDSILVKPVFQERATEVMIYFPGEGKISWYDIDSTMKYGDASTSTVPVTMHRIPVFQKEGTIVPRKMRIRRSTVPMMNDPYTLVMVADKQGQAEGTLYIDDETTFEYRNGKYLYFRLKLDGLKISSTILQKLAMYETDNWLERIDIVNPPMGVSKAIIHSAGQADIDLEATYSPNNVLIIRKPGVNMGKEWSIDLIA